MSAVAEVMTAVREHIKRFVERPHPAFGGQPVCPFARRARADGRVSVTVVPFSAADDSAVEWALSGFDAGDQDVLLVVHPDPAGLTYPELAEIRDRFAGHLAGRYAVFTGHPADPFVRAGVRTRLEPHPTLHFVRADRLADAEARLSPRRLAFGQPPSPG